MFGSLTKEVYIFALLVGWAFAIFLGNTFWFQLFAEKEINLFGILYCVLLLVLAQGDDELSKGFSLLSWIETITAGAVYFYAQAGTIEDEAPYWFKVISEGVRFTWLFACTGHLTHEE